LGGGRGGGVADTLEVGTTPQSAHGKQNNATNWCEINGVLLDKERWKVLHLCRNNQLTAKTEDKARVAIEKEM